ncbi:hypothetical protein ASE41_17010 [Streptomyces sp. Root264]|nr:hypothetical protein ASE41_17010 [Streptomyces sp. Root264]
MRAFVVMAFVGVVAQIEVAQTVSAFVVNPQTEPADLREAAVVLDPQIPILTDPPLHLRGIDQVRDLYEDLVDIRAPCPVLAPAQLLDSL